MQILNPEPPADLLLVMLVRHELFERTKLAAWSAVIERTTT
jgi:hypothetical protein